MSNTTTQSLSEFVQDWTTQYQQQAQSLKLFTPNSIDWSTHNRAKFAKLFYHIRGHYYQFLWYVGSTAPSWDYKKIVLDNTTEEFGKGSKSHDQLYWQFAKDCGVDIIPEIFSEEYNLEFVRKFNHNFLELTLKEDWDKIWGAFSAYEALDNSDYSNLLRLVNDNFELSASGKVFFKVHANATHYESTEQLLTTIWNENPQAVKDGFGWVMKNQLAMWQELGDQF